MSSASAVPGTEFVMSKFFGLTYEQALRVQALLRLGISEEDVRVAERLMAPRSTTERGTKVEWLLGCTVEQMSYKKALEVLGISEAMMEEDRAKALGSLGVRAWANPTKSTGMEGVDGDNTSSSCGPIFGKRLRTNDQEAPLSTEADVTELEDTCFSQHLRIQQLELEVAALSESGGK